MKKLFLLFALCSLLFASLAFAADVYIGSLTEDTSPALTDKIETEKATPASRYLQLQTLLQFIAAQDGTPRSTAPTGADLIANRCYVADNESGGWDPNNYTGPTGSETVDYWTCYDGSSFYPIRDTLGNPIWAGISELMPFFDDDGTGSIRIRFNTSTQRDITIPGDAAITLSYTVASGDIALATSEIASGACTAAQTDTATGTATTDVVWWGFAADPTATTGYSPTANGMLTIIAYPTSGNVNFKVCNNTGAAITPGTVTLNWRVVR
jgi:hypothetical protein